MFERPGRKLKIVAIIIFFFFTLLGMACGYVFAANSQNDTQAGIITLVLGSDNPMSTITVIIGGIIGMVVGWINSIVLYSYGSLVDNVEEFNIKLK